jgi:RNA polymerase sigma-70 factor, ECF subfamily
MCWGAAGSGYRPRTEAFTADETPGGGANPSERFSRPPVLSSRDPDGSATMTLDAETGTSQAADDRLLLSQVARQDRRAFEQLYRRYHRRVFHFVLRLVRHEGAAEEVVGDTMFAVWQGAGTFEGASAVSTWVLGIAYRQAMKLVDRNRKHSLVDSDDELLARTVDGDPAADPESVAMTDNYAALLQEGLAALPEGHRVVVELTAMGHSSGEISLVVGCPENTVRTRMFHARQQLRRHMEKVERHGPARGAGVTGTTRSVVGDEDLRSHATSLEAHDLRTSGFN